MKFGKNNFLIQVKYSDLISDADNIERYFLDFGGELYFTAEEIYDYEPKTINGIKSFVKSNRLPLRLHAPIVKIDYSRLENTISRMLPIYAEAIRLGRILNVNSIVAHAEFDYHADFPIDKQLKRAVSLWRILCDESSANNIRINIENHYEIKPEHLIMLMKNINSPYVGACVDIGHSNAFSNLSIKKWLKKYPAGLIKEAHLADNKGDDDTHLALGDGNIDFAGFFEILVKRSEDCVFVLEPTNINDAQKSLSYLRKIGVL